MQFELAREFRAKPTVIVSCQRSEHNYGTIKKQTTRERERESIVAALAHARG